MSAFFDNIIFEEDSFKGVEIQVCGETKTVQFGAWDHGNGSPPDWLNCQQAAISLDDAEKLIEWLTVSIKKAKV